MSLYFLHCVFFQLLVAVFVGHYFQGNYGNGLVWLCLLLGPPLAVTTYFHDHYISFLSASSSPQMSNYSLPVFLQPHWSRGNVYHLMLYITVHFEGCLCLSGNPFWCLENLLDLQSTTSTPVQESIMYLLFWLINGPTLYWQIQILTCKLYYDNSTPDKYWCKTQLI